MRGYETVLSHYDENCSVDERHQENIPHDTNIIFSYIFVPHVITNEIENVSDDDVDKSNPTSKSFSLILLDVSNGSPVFAVLLTICK